MTTSQRICLICNCENTMDLDADQLSAGPETAMSSMHRHLCRSQLNAFEQALEQNQQLLVACTQESPLFQEIADEHGRAEDVSFVNIRETAGWTKSGEDVHAKVSALLAAATVAPQPARLKPVGSDGLCLVYGSGQAVLDIAKLLSDRLSVTVLLSDDAELLLPTVLDFPIFRGDITAATGSFGNFSITVDNYAPLLPSTRSSLNFTMARDGAASSCSLILDCSGNAPLFTGHAHRDGYKRVDPADPAHLYRVALELTELVGEFEKPIYVDYDSSVCAHARSQQVGCTNCLDLCPAGAITADGDGVAIDDGVCGGCGSCNARCPTGAIAYQYPNRTDWMRQTRTLLESYAGAGGRSPVILLHDDSHGTPLIGAMARYGRGLPGRVLPVALHATTMPGHIEILSLMAAGAETVVLLSNPKFAEELAGLEEEIALANSIAGSLELAVQPRFHLLTTADPDEVAERLWALPVSPVSIATAFSPVGRKRDIARLVMGSLHEIAPEKPDRISLPASAPYGAVTLAVDACTLCMACVSACPASALVDTPGEPKLRFIEANCVQCGICTATCPESALTLDPGYNFATSAQEAVTLKEEEPFDCIVCGTPFATQSTIKKIRTQLAGQHSMFADAERARVIEMCENCRVETLANSTDDPFSSNARPRVRTTEDYLQAEAQPRTANEFLIDDD